MLLYYYYVRAVTSSYIEYKEGDDILPSYDV